MALLKSQRLRLKPSQIIHSQAFGGDSILLGLQNSTPATRLYNQLLPLCDYAINLPLPP